MRSTGTASKWPRSDGRAAGAVAPDEYLARSNWSSDAAFTGGLDQVKIWNGARTAAQIRQDMTAVPSGTDPTLVAYYPLSEGQGPIAHDQAPVGSTGRCDQRRQSAKIGAVRAGHRPGGDGVTQNSTAPRQGPTTFRTSRSSPPRPTADSRAGWAAAPPDTTFRIDVFASAGYGPGGAGEAEDYLGSLEVTTNSQGQAIFDVPYTPSAGMPVVTAAATDPEGNTSEVSALRRSSLQAPPGFLDLTPPPRWFSPPQRQRDLARSHPPPARSIRSGM